MATTVGDIVNGVITELSQVPGVATQIYSAGRIRQFVQDAIIMEQDEMWWPTLMWYQKIPLDGVNGFLTQDIKGPISFVDDYEDVATVFVDGTDQKLPELPQSINPFNLTSSRAVYISADLSVPHRPFRAWPASAAGSVVVWARQSHAMPITDQDNVYLDALLLQFDATWMYCVDDGTVPAQVNKFQMLAAKRRKVVKAAFAQHGLLLDPRLPAGTIQEDFSANTFILDSPAVMIP